MFNRLDVVARARHDLGKYVAFQTRCLEPGAPIEDVRAALDVDLKATRSTPLASCSEVWAELRPAFVTTGVDPDEIAFVDDAVSRLTEGAAGLAQADAAALARLCTTAVELGDRLRALHRCLLAADADIAADEASR